MIDLEHIELLTKKQIISTEMIDAIYDEAEDDKRELLIIHVEERAKELDCDKSFKKIIAAKRAMLKEARKEMKEKAAAQVTAAGAPVNEYVFVPDESKPEEFEILNTGKWIVDANGIKYYFGTIPIIASRYPIVITQCLTDKESWKEKIELVWKKDSVWKNITTERINISSSARIVGLSNYGFPVDSECAKQLVTYLSDFEKFNSSGEGAFIKRRTSISKFGWVDNEFMPYSKEDIVFDDSIGYKTLTDSVKERGKYEKWLKLVKDIRKSGRIEPLIYLAASFGSALLQLLNISPFMVNLYGTSGKGKTVNLMLAASVWANPKKFIAESTSTLNSLEQQLNVLNNLPLMVDDLSKVQSKGDESKLSDMIYNLCSGQGKGRLSKDIKQRDPATWDNIILTNMERPLASESMQGGAINRVLDFCIGEGYIFENGNAVVKAVSSNYGHAGEKFIKVVQEHKKEIIQLIEKYETAIKNYTEKSKQQKEEKQITPLAVLYTADELSEKYIFRDGARLGIEVADQLQNVENVSEMERALDYLRDEVARNRGEYGLIADWKGKRSGYIKYGETVFIKSAFNEIARKYNFSPKQFLKWAKNERKILVFNSNRIDKKVKTPGYESSSEAKYMNCYVLRLDDDFIEKTAENDDFSEIPIDETPLKDGNFD